MQRTHTIVVGGGQAGLAMSRCLYDRYIDHLVLERGRVAERWRTERWDSLRTLTPAWQTRLPGHRYQGADLDRYLTMPEVTRLLEGYAASFSAPVLSETRVLCVERMTSGFRVETDRGDFHARNVVIATGHCDVPRVPSFAERLPARVTQITPSRYKRPSDVPDGGVLVVGASASGVLIASELRAAGRSVTLATGKHTRLPRRYRGRDILWWLDAMGTLREVVDTDFDRDSWRRQPSFQLAAGTETLDLAALARAGVRITGRVVGVEGERVRFARDLCETTAAADAKMQRLLARVDVFTEQWGLRRIVDPPCAPEPFAPAPGPDELDLDAERISTVVWATGFRRRYPWLRAPVLDACGEIAHRGGITEVPGLYVLGLRFLRTRSSNFIDGVGRDAAHLADHIDLSSRSGRRDAA